jgi:hypothetical protein
MTTRAGAFIDDILSLQSPAKKRGESSTGALSFMHDAQRTATMTNTIDHGLRHDIRLLGQLLGEILRGHEGEALYAKVEDIRQTALRFRREDDPAAARRLDTLLRKLSRDETIGVVRAFSYFSHLANIAEDRHLVRRQEAEGAARPDSSRARWRHCRNAASAAAGCITARRRLPDAGADRPPDRSATQEHPRC